MPLELLQIFLVVLGILGVIWGINDVFGEGQQSSVGSKKIVGGIAFAVISYFLMNWAIQQVGNAAAKAGISSSILPAVTWAFHNMTFPG